VRETGRCKAFVVACRTPSVTITGTTARGIGFLATIFGRQAVEESVGNARESNIERECVGTKDNEVTGSQQEDKVQTEQENTS